MYASPEQFIWLHHAEEDRRLRDLERARVARERAQERYRAEGAISSHVELPTPAS
jgi:hypothetical protein